MLNQGNRWSVEAAVQLSGAAPGKVVADLGFGGGIGLSLLLDRVGNSGVVYGIDISRDMLNRARSRYAAEVGAGRLKLVEGSLTELPVGDGSLDAAITVNTLYFVPELGRACAELFRVLRPGGLLVVGIGDPDMMGRLPFSGYVTLRSVADVAAAIRNAGFELVEQRQLRKGLFRFHLLVGRR
jgi:arsenite methyltransferase